MTKLTDQSSWTTWYQELQIEASLYGNWHLIDPEAKDVLSPLTEADSLMTQEEYINSLYISALKEYSIKLSLWIESPVPQEQRESEPIKPTIKTKEQTKDDYTVYLKLYTITEAERSRQRDRYQAIYNWIRKTVAAELFTLTCMKLSIEGTEPTLQAIIRGLKQRLAPSESNTTLSPYYRI